MNNSKSSNVFVDIVVYSFTVAGIYLMTASSTGAGLVKAATGGYAGIISASIGK